MSEQSPVISLALLAQNGYELACQSLRSSLGKTVTRIRDGDLRADDARQPLTDALVQLSALYVGNLALQATGSALPEDPALKRTLIQTLGEDNTRLLKDTAVDLVFTVGSSLGEGEVNLAAGYLPHALRGLHSTLWDSRVAQPVSQLVPLFQAAFEGRPNALKSLNLQPPRPPAASAAIRNQRPAAGRNADLETSREQFPEQ